ncbi:hypothetical protein BD311DRAFT_44952 [Dichomitus squalens]|uniref:Uncharacterized protein n=1 Tax=Dichomitus squalens TaxID=114155 RepID=A0A4Q9MAC1_9APHY|nr:hypothetical protein BD311DRAFT_44952 [Dichomitus squalens]
MSHGTSLAESAERSTARPSFNRPDVWSKASRTYVERLFLHRVLFRLHFVCIPQVHEGSRRINEMKRLNSLVINSDIQTAACLFLLLLAQSQSCSFTSQALSALDLISEHGIVYGRPSVSCQSSLLNSLNNRTLLPSGRRLTRALFLFANSAKAASPGRPRSPSFRIAQSSIEPVRSIG